MLKNTKLKEKILLLFSIFCIFIYLISLAYYLGAIKVETKDNSIIREVYTCKYEVIHIDSIDIKKKLNELYEYGYVPILMNNNFIIFEKMYYSDEVLTNE